MTKLKLKAKAAPEKPRAAPKVAFPKKAQAPTHAEFAARLPAPTGKRFEVLRTYLNKQGAAEDFYYYGPRTGWGYRYLKADQSLCSIVLSAGRLVGIVSDRDLRRARGSRDIKGDPFARARERRTITISPAEPLSAAARRMIEHSISALPVVEAGRLVGLLTATDLVDHCMATLWEPESFRPR